MFKGMFVTNVLRRRYYRRQLKPKQRQASAVAQCTPSSPHGQARICFGSTVHIRMPLHSDNWTVHTPPLRTLAVVRASIDTDSTYITPSDANYVGLSTNVSNSQNIITRHIRIKKSGSTMFCASSSN